MNDFPFSIMEVADLLNLHARRRNAVGIDVDCPFCHDRKGKMNINRKKNVFKCNRCGESGGMLALYGKVTGVDNPTAYTEILEALGKGDKVKNVPLIRQTNERIEEEYPEIPQASDEVKNKTYTCLLQELTLTEVHKKNLLDRGFTEQQIEQNEYKSTPVFGFKKIAASLQKQGCTLCGVPGFYQEEDGKWSMRFTSKSSGFMIPIRNVHGLIVGMQIRLDRPYDGRKYIWFSSAGMKTGVTSGSPVHLAGEVGDKTVFVTEGPLKGDLAHALSGRCFVCVPGVNQYANLKSVLRFLKECGTTRIYEAYDMDKLLNLECRHDYDEHCKECDSCGYKQSGICERKKIKRENIQRGCLKLVEICCELGLEGRQLIWDIRKGDVWKECVKGIDDYLFSLRTKNKEPENYHVIVREKL